MSRYSTFSRTALGHFKSTTMMALAACAMELGSAQAATLVRTSAFVYDANGLLQHEIVEPTNPALCVATDYLRDAWGNVSSTTVRNCAGTSYPNPNPGGTPVVEAPAPTSSTLQVSSRIILATYDVAGRFPQTVVNKGITPNQSETRYYDSRWGRQIYEQGPNGLVTTWGYDTLGRKTNELRADGTAITFFGPTQIAASGGSNYYQVTSTVSGIPQAGLGVVPVAPATLQQFDAYDRPVCSATQAFDNTVGATWYATCQAYDALGRVNQISTPLATSQPTAAPTGSTAPIGAASALPASAAAHTTTIYDPLGRVTGVMDPLNNSTTTKYEGLVTVTTDARANANSASPQNTVTKTRNAIGQVVEVEDVYGSVTSFGYEPFGNVVQTNAGGALTVAQFDLKGRRTSLSDPDTVGSATAPAWTYTYDVLGQLVQQTDAKSQVTTMAYDALGRLTSRTDLAGTTNASTSYWEYDQANSNCGASSGAVIGKLDRAWTWPGGYTRIECHDALGRTSAATTALGSTTAGGVSTSLSYTSLQQYDGASRPSTLTYPTGLTVQNNYNTNGYLASVANVATTELAGTTVFWQTSSLDPFGHVTAEVLGNGLSTRRGYYLDGRLQQISTGPGLASLPAASAIALQNETYTYDQNLNVSQRTWIAGGVEKSENFGYDLLNRLQTVSGPASKAYNYDALGNLTGKSDLGTYAYPAPTAIGPHHPASITGTINGVVNPSFVYDNNGNETSGPGTTITWTPNNMVSSVTVSGVTDMFYYGPERQRYEEVTAPKTTFYVSAQQFEVNVTTGGTSTTSYIYAGGTLVAQFTAAAGATSGALRYFHQNNQGSTVLVTNEIGGAVEAYSYDAWGKRRNLDGTDGVQARANFTPDYTGQEAMDTVGLVNMNGRIYNPTTAQFLSADPLVQAPANLQSYNRYSYVWNNPLTMTDPSGFCGNLFSDLGCYVGDTASGLANGLGSAITTIAHSDTGRTAMAIAAAYFTGFGNFGAYGQGIFGYQEGMFGFDVITPFANAVAGGFVGGVVQSNSIDGGLNGAEAATLFYVAGSVANGNLSLAVVTHATAGCASASISGGTCANGAISGAIPEAAEMSDTYRGLAQYQPVVAAAVVGGTASALSGGRFSNGAFTSAYGYLFNCLSHPGTCTKADIPGIRAAAAACNPLDSACISPLAAMYREAGGTGVPAADMGSSVGTFVGITATAGATAGALIPYAIDTAVPAVLDELGPSGSIFGRARLGGSSIFDINANDFLRIGWGWVGDAKTGTNVFRISGDWIKAIGVQSGHIDLFKWP